MIIMAIMIIIIRLATGWPPPRDSDGPPHLPAPIRSAGSVHDFYNILE